MNTHTDPSTAPSAHSGLADRLRDAGRICTSPAAEPACPDCPPEQLEQCRASLREAVGQLMDLMLDYFNREDALMRSLPDSGPSRGHCIRHREDHVAISTRYNKIVGNLDTDDVVSSSRTLDALVGAWLHEHARRYDVELASMLYVERNDRAS